MNWHWVAVHFGTINGSYNLFWSGFGSDIGEIAILGALVQATRHANCHQKGCWRVGLHRVGDSPYRVCHHHHPAMTDRNISAEHIGRHHNDWVHRS